MPDFSLLELLSAIAKPLASENQARSNSAAVGGTDAHVLSLVQRALDAFDAGKLPSSAEFPLQRLFDLWTRYADAEESERQHILDSTQRILVLLRAADLRPDSSSFSAPAPQVLERASAHSPGLTHIAAPSPAAAPDEYSDEDDAIVNEEVFEMDAAQRHVEELAVPVPAAPPALETDWEQKPSFRDYMRATQPETAAPQIVAAPPKPKKPRAKPAKAEADESEADVDAELMYLKGVGPYRLKLLAKMNLKTVRDLITHYPARHEDRGNIKPVGALEAGAKESTQVTILYPPQTHAMSGRMAGRTITKVRAGDDTGRIDLQWWNQAWREKQFQVGMKLFVYGKVSEFNGFLQMESPAFEILSESDEAAQNAQSAQAAPGEVGRIVPVYPATEGLLQPHLRRAIADALDKYLPTIPDPLPPQVLEEYNLRPLDWSLRQIHFPDSEESKEEARYRLIFEELFLMQVALAQKKQHVQIAEAGLRHDVSEEKIKGWLASLPFKLTQAQKKAMNEVRRDMKAPRPMNRLLHGDVGSGKTMVAAYALWAAHASGMQGAMLAPTEILAEQHFSTLTRLFKPLGIEVALLEGSLKAKNKRRIQEDLNEGRVSIVVGTHALIQEGIEFKRLSVAIVDEQHRFGVMQRAALQAKGAGGIRPDVLVMTATPIPRTLALTIYGDLDVSILDELPPGRQPIKTKLIKPTQREKAYDFVRVEVSKGRQAYVVCPLVEESEKLAHLKAATALAEGLRENELKDLRVGLVHGQMDVIERDEQMEMFRAGMHDVLVSTTVIEVGVDVPNSTIMIIEDAERFGLSQLHQLRGRVGRGIHKSHCFLLSDPKTDEGKSRLNAMCKTQNGFEIAEYDLQLRGPGEFYGTRQSGLPDFRIADILNDVEIIAEARAAAFDLVSQDPALEWEEHEDLREAVLRFWGEKLPMMQVS
jgi:ATP-dependent DNA helicase RecG